MTSKTDSKEKRWVKYYDAVTNHPARPTLLKALEWYESDPSASPGQAIDLGCGSGRDTYELLRRGWQVLAIDQEAEGIHRTKQNLPPEFASQLSTQIVRFEHVVLPPTQLINGSYSLPFCPPQHFDAFWQKIVDSLMPGDLFAGHLFGDRDGWVGNRELTFHTQAEVEQRLKEFEIIEFDERDEDGSTATGTAKHWHVFSIVAKKLSGLRNKPNE
ncbi:MAG: class I SAM-dependent methyltransferase [Chloroflexota bacterium]